MLKDEGPRVIEKNFGNRKVEILKKVYEPMFFSMLASGFRTWAWKLNAQYFMSY